MSDLAPLISLLIATPSLLALTAEELAAEIVATERKTTATVVGSDLGSQLGVDNAVGLTNYVRLLRGTSEPIGAVADHIYICLNAPTPWAVGLDFERDLITKLIDRATADGETAIEAIGRDLLELGTPKKYPTLPDYTLEEVAAALQLIGVLDTIQSRRTTVELKRSFAVESLDTLATQVRAGQTVTVPTVAELLS